MLAPANAPSLWANWRLASAFNVPIEDTNPLINNRIGHTGSNGALPDAVWLDRWATLAAIVGLLLPCFPSAIVRRITPVVINSAKCQLNRSFAHILIKPIITPKSLPTVTDKDAALAIVLVSRMPWVRASAQHGRPFAIGSVEFAVNASSRMFVHGLNIHTT